MPFFSIFSRKNALFLLKKPEKKRRPGIARRRNRTCPAPCHDDGAVTPCLAERCDVCSCVPERPKRTSMEFFAHARQTTSNDFARTAPAHIRPTTSNGPKQSCKNGLRAYTQGTLKSTLFSVYLEGDFERDLLVILCGGDLHGVLSWRRHRGACLAAPMVFLHWRFPEQPERPPGTVISHTCQMTSQALTKTAHAHTRKVH